MVNEEDVETIDYNNDSDEDMFTKESIVIAANKILDKNKKSDEDKYVKQSVAVAANKILDRYKKYQAESNLDKADTINYVDDIDIAGLKENKNAAIAAKKNKYKKLPCKRKRQRSP